MKQNAADLVVQCLQRIAVQHPCIVRAYLFGSRARKDNRPTSDYDFCFELEPNCSTQWAIFAQEFREKNPTLLSLDLVKMNEAPEDLREKIENEKVLVYERN